MREGKREQRDHRVADGNLLNLDNVAFSESMVHSFFLSLSLVVVFFSCSTFTSTRRYGAAACGQQNRYKPILNVFVIEFFYGVFFFTLKSKRLLSYVNPRGLILVLYRYTNVSMNEYIPYV